jgi:hypothetical protein
MKTFQLFAIATLMLSITSSAALASERYPTEQELRTLTQQLKRNIPKLKKSSMYRDRRTPVERQQVKSLVDAWAKADPAIAPFLGTWTAIEESMSIYPSTTQGQICIIEIFLADQGSGVSFSTAIVAGNRLRANDQTVKIKEGEFLGSAFVVQGKPGIYEYAHPRPLDNPGTMDFLREKPEILEQFEQADCSISSPN